MLHIDPRKGGRGRVAPYQTTHCRVPLELKDLIDKISNEYKTVQFRQSQTQLNQFVSDLRESFDKVCNPLFKDSKEFPDIEEAKELAAKILKGRRSAKVSLEKLLTVLYNSEVKL